MRNLSTLVLALGVAAASLTSCSRANYAFNDKAPAYLGVQPARNVAARPVSAPAVAPVAMAATVAPVVAPAVVAVPAVAATPAKAQVAAPSALATAAAANTTINTKPVLSRAERKAVRRQVISAMAAHSGISAEGKSQLVALLLCIFLGTLGIARFYLGYSGRGVLMLVLTLLVITAIVSFILNIIDLIKIINGDLKPSGGDYTTKL